MNALRTVFRAFFIDDGGMSMFAGLIPGTLFMDSPVQPRGETPDDLIRHVEEMPGDGGKIAEASTATPKAGPH
jgi:hypothetical protein